MPELRYTHIPRRLEAGFGQPVEEGTIQYNTGKQSVKIAGTSDQGGFKDIPHARGSINYVPEYERPEKG